MAQNEGADLIEVKRNLSCNLVLLSALHHLKLSQQTASLTLCLLPGTVSNFKELLPLLSLLDGHLGLALESLHSDLVLRNFLLALNDAV